MTKVNQDLEFYQGEGKTIIVDVGVTLSGKVASWVVTKREGDTTFLIQKDHTDFTIVDGTKYRIPVSRADTTDLSPKDYYHELRIGDGSQTSVVSSTGKFTVKLSPTREL